MENNHGDYGRFKTVKYAELVRPGGKDQNGAGAIRKIVVPGVTFLEEIPSFESPHFFEYKIKECTANIGSKKVKIPLHHELGRLEFRENQESTEVNWISKIEVRIPFLGGLLTKKFAALGRKGFSSMLKQVKTELEIA